MKIKLAPSILSADFKRLAEQVQAAISAGAEFIHVDVMDGHFVPNITVGPAVVEALKPITASNHVILDVHLMIEKPERMIPDFIKAGADMLTVHVETCPHLHRTIQVIKNANIMAGVTLNPATPLAALGEILPDVDLVLIMSVNPGFGGQSYIPASTARIARLRDILNERGLSQVELQVDGGVHRETVAEIVRAGATVLVAGSAVFNSPGSIAENMAVLREAIRASQI